MKIFTIGFIVCVLFSLAAILFELSRDQFLASQEPKGCVPVVPAQESKLVIYQLDHDSKRFASTSMDVMGRSTEGGTQTNYTDRGIKRIIEQRFYGETGQAYMRFYFKDNVIFAIVKLNTNYEVPINIDPSAKIKDTEEKDYYLDEDGRICSMAINGKSITVDNDNQEMIREYIAGIE